MTTTQVGEARVSIVNLIASAVLTGATTFVLVMMAMTSVAALESPLERSAVQPYDVFFLLIRPLSIPNVLGTLIIPLFLLLVCSLVWYTRKRPFLGEHSIQKGILFLVSSCISYAIASLFVIGLFCGGFYGEWKGW